MCLFFDIILDGEMGIEEGGDIRTRLHGGVRYFWWGIGLLCGGVCLCPEGSVFTVIIKLS